MMELTKVLKELEVMSDLSFRDDLYSEKFYETLRRINVSKVYTDECSSLDKLNLGKGIKRICAKVLNYLETVHKGIYNKDDPYDVCILLSFWVYSRLFDILQNENNVYLAYAQIQLIWTDFLIKKSYNELCKPITEMVSHKDWRKRKELYEYYVDYSANKKIFDIYEKGCEDFYVYVENKASLYEHFENLCPKENTNICPEFYNDTLKYKPENVLSTFKCHHEIIKKREADARNAPQRAKALSESEPISEEGDGRMKTFDPPNLSGKSQAVENLGNVLLGVVATTMTSGALYRVNINSLIQINCISLLMSFITSA
ncbi:Plasmodium vivax Vir protein, putative [Plasmodium vivax]|nr:Plasmodium vivax Vir protein, putative [Plasmodium vivax]